MITVDQVEVVQTGRKVDDCTGDLPMPLGAVPAPLMVAQSRW